MTILFFILLFIISLITITLVAAFFMKKEHYVIREITINAPPQKVYDFLKLLKNQDKFNKWAQADPNRNWEYTGTDGTEGFIISWSGNNKAGKGEKEIMKLVEGKRIETQIRFTKPMTTTANINMELTFLANNQTKVSMSNSGELKYPMNIFIPLAEKNFPKDMDSSLLVLKSILEE